MLDSESEHTNINDVTKTIADYIHEQTHVHWTVYQNNTKISKSSSGSSLRNISIYTSQAQTTAI